MKETYRGFEIRLGHDDDALSPREWDNLGTLALFHRCYANESDLRHEDYGGWEEMREHIESRKGLDAICVPVYLYAHGGHTVSTTPFSCPWDSGQIGYCYVTRKKAREWFGWDRITVERELWITAVLEAEIVVLDQYVRGEVYYYTIESDKGIEGSCGDIYGEGEALTAARDEVDRWLKVKANENAKELLETIGDHNRV